MVFPPDYRIRLMFNSPQPGYLYLVNEGPVVNNGSPAYNVLFPSPVHNGGSALLQPNQEIAIPSEKEFFVFDKQEGEEKLWLVWARENVPEMEAVKSWVNWQDRGTIKDTRQAGVVKQFLAGHSTRPPSVEKDERNGRTVVRAAGDVLVGLLRLEHH
jgi:hypothetical protein